MRWDIFCRVIDNHGDLGVCWRLARALADGGDTVRLWLDDARALAWMAPAGHPRVAVGDWAQARWPTPPRGAEAVDGVGVVGVVLEAFGCDPPAPYVAAMAAATPPPRWINLEYLSAEAYAERSHRLPSPQLAGPGRGLTKWFFYPGFSAASGGLIHGDPAPTPAQAERWLHAQPWFAPRDGERRVSAFCYPHADWIALLRLLAADPAAPPLHLLAAPGAARDVLRAQPLPPGTLVTDLPWLTQPDYDRLLAACDLNLVRGEDSFARAQLVSDAPLLWHIYPQHDGAHAAKLDAFLDRWLASAADDGATATAANDTAALWRAWNGLAPWPARLPAQRPWRALHQSWHAGLRTQTDLVHRLRDFVGAAQ